MKIVYLAYEAHVDCDFPLIKAWRENGHEVWVFYFESFRRTHFHLYFNLEGKFSKSGIYSTQGYKELEPYTDYIDLSKTYIVYNNCRREWFLPSQLLYLKLSNRIAKLHPDTVITTAPPKLKLALWRFRKNMMFVIHDPFMHSGEYNKKDEYYRRMCFRFGKKFVLLNENQVDGFCQLYHVKRERVLVNKIGVLEATTAHLKSEVNSRDQSMNILWFGRVSPYKGIDTLCKVMTEVHKIIPKTSLTIAGGGNFYFDISPYKNLNYIHIIHHFLTTEELACLMNACSFVCLPYTDATQSGVVMTCYAFKKPVLATNVGGLNNQIDNGKTGMLVTPKNGTALANAIITLLSDEKLLREMEQNIENKYYSSSSEYSWSAISKEYIEFAKKTIS